MLRAASWGTARAADADVGKPATWTCAFVPCPQLHQNIPDRSQHDHKVSKLTIKYTLVKYFPNSHSIKIISHRGTFWGWVRWAMKAEPK